MLQRLFFALWPDDSVRTHLAGLAEQARHRCGGRRTADDKLHLTLAFLGDVSPPQVDELIALTQQLTGPEGTWTLDRLGHFPRGGIVWAGSEAVPEQLLDFQAELWASLATLGFIPPQRPFRPHVTLLRQARQRASHDIAAGHLPLAWTYHRAALVHSAVDGPRRRYVTLAQTRGPDQ
ncbi:RNA 2',3'-cyclic phosphodiesterase [Modicisalibacter luteus]|uniref:RNA 2',3'-cyclic phosphodiesterase n=1 Tax=Modicisalibacter luteus TaxID=453962 RepID=A0ABV7LYX1_9GAMM|nr:RNA 2',3'-cyclic phosphodiesterase [Halomonas lutea]GHB00867.1 RNA 2',3'-cyclic phosphodiesterase [Halomonas lutea]